MMKMDKESDIFNGTLCIQKKLLQKFPVRKEPVQLNFFYKDVHKCLFPKLNLKKEVFKSNNFSNISCKGKLMKNNCLNNHPVHKDSFSKKKIHNSFNYKKIKIFKRSSISSNNISRSSFNYSSSKNSFEKISKNYLDISSTSNDKKILEYNKKSIKDNNQTVNEITCEQTQLDKRQRFQIYMKCLESKKGASSIQEAIELINTTLDEVEDKYAPKIDDKTFGINSKKYGRMWPVPKLRIKSNSETGKTEMLTTGLNIIIDEDGSFEIWTLKRGNFDKKKIFHKNAFKSISSTNF